MSRIEQIKKVIGTQDRNNLIPLLVNVIFGDDIKLRDFNTSDMFYTDDIALVPREISGEHIDFFICNEDGVTGIFNRDKWNPYTMGTSNTGNTIVGTQTVTSDIDGITQFKMDVEGFKPETGNAIINHSVSGRMKFGEDWTFSYDYSFILLLKTCLYEGETLVIDYFS